MRYFTFYLVFLSLFFFSCSDLADTQLPEYEPEFAIPLIEDAIVTVPAVWQSNDPNQSLVISPEGQLIFQYESPETTIQARDLLGGTLNFLLRATVPMDDNKVPLLPDDLGIDLNVEEAIFAGGLFNLTYNTDNFTSDGIDIIFTIPELTKDGIPLQLIANSAQANFISFPIEGYTVMPTNNQLTITYTAFNELGVPQELLDITMLFSPQIQVIKGFLGRQEIDIPPGTIPIDLFDDRFLNGTIQFAEPKISARAENAFGVPVRTQIEILDAFRPNGETIVIDASAIDQRDINYPSVNDIGTSEMTEIFLDHTNSNLAVVFNEEVTAVEYDLTAVINADNDTTITSFLTDSSFFKIQVFVEVPVIGSVKDFSTEGTYAVSLAEELEDIESIKEGEIKLIIDNGIPLAAAVQVNFLDQDGVVLDSLFQELRTLAAGAPIDALGFTAGTQETINFIPITTTQIDALQQTEAIQVKVLFNTSGTLKQPVHILDNQELRVRMGLRFTL